MKPKYKLGMRVQIHAFPKSDGRLNSGKVVGVEAIQDATYIGYVDENEFLKRFSEYTYKVAYIDCFTKKACAAWYRQEDLT